MSEIMDELRRQHSELVDVLKEYRKLPDDVHIGKNSPVDKVRWLIRRLTMKEKTVEKKWDENESLTAELAAARARIEQLEAALRTLADRSIVLPANRTKEQIKNEALTFVRSNRDIAREALGRGKQ